MAKPLERSVFSFGIAESLRAAFLAFHYPSYPLPWFLHELRIVLLNSINGVALRLDHVIRTCASCGM